MGYYAEPGFGYGCGPTVPVGGGGFAAGFALILVLFILLVIIGAAWTAY